MTNTTMACLSDFEDYAKLHLPRTVYLLICSGADAATSVKDNIAAFHRLKIRPRMMRNVSNIDLSTSVLGYRIKFPVCVAPSGYHKLVHPEAEIATARGTNQAGVIFCQSSHSYFHPEDVSNELLKEGHFTTSVGSNDHLLFYQLFILKDRQRCLELIQRVEKAGYKAIVLTVDTPAISKKYWQIRESDSLRKHAHVKFAEFPEYEKTIPGEEIIDPAVTWEDVRFLRAHIKVKFIIKGILTAEDAELAVSCGCDGIIVSNHGGRQMDCTLATIDALPEVVDSVHGRCEVYMDGGVRYGTDVFKALALGAKAVFIGRSALYGLAYNGSDGVKQVLDILRDELHTNMAMAGCASVGDIKPSMIDKRFSTQAKL